MSIDVAEAITVNSSGNVSIRSLHSEEKIAVLGGSFAVAAASEMNGGLAFSKGTLVTNGSLIVAGDSSWTGGTICGLGGVANTGTLTLSGSSVKGLGYSAFGTTVPGILNNSGTIIHRDLGGLEFRHSTATALNNLASGVYDLQGDAGLTWYNGVGTVNNSGIFRKSGGTGTSVISTAFNNTGGTVRAQSGTLAFKSSYTQTGGATILDGGAITSSSTPNIQGGLVGGSGTISGSVSNTAGQVGPGSSPGALTITGSYTQGAAGALNIELGGTTPGAGYDQLVVGSSVTLAGALNVSLISPFVPAIGSTFMVLNKTGSGAISGTFAGLAEGYTFNAAGCQFRISYKGGNGNDVVLTTLFSNSPPVADADGPYTVAEGDSVTLNGTGSDPNGDALTFAWDLDNDGTFETAGQHPTFSAAGRDGPASQTVVLKVSDPAGAFATSASTVCITNVAPQFDAGPDAVLEAADAGVFSRHGIAFSDPGPDVWSGTVAWGDGTADQPLTIDPGAKSFGLNHTFTSEGTYTVRVTLDDGAPGGTATDLFQVEVHLNNPPVAANQWVVMDEDAVAAITLTAADPDDDPLTYSLVTQPLHGTLSGALPELLYTPDADYFGPDRFTFTANDGKADSNLAEVWITIRAANDPPVGQADTYTVPEDTVLNVGPPGVLANDSDVEGDSLTAVLLTGPAHGQLDLRPDGSFTYLPEADFNGTDDFTTYLAYDGQAYSDPVAVTIIVTGVNDAPRAANQSLDLNEDTAAAIGLLATDVDADPLTYTVTTAPLHGMLSGSGADLVYTPDADYNGPDQFTWKANDGALDSNEAVVLLAVRAVNDAPRVVQPFSDVTADEDAPATVLDLSAAFGDVDLVTNGDSVTLAVAGNTNPGLVVAGLDGTLLTLTCLANQNGTAEITIQATDTAGAAVADTFLVTVNAVNDTPTVVQPIGDVTVAEDAAATVLDLSAAFGDVDIVTNGDSVTLAVAGNTNPGLVVAGFDGTLLTLTYPANQNGTAEITIQATDTAGAAVTDTFLVTVQPVNDQPVADGQTVTVTEDGQVSITLHGSDVETAAADLTFTITAVPGRGILTDNAGHEVGVGQVFVGAPTLRFAPGAACDQLGTVALDFTVTDRGDPDTPGGVGLTSHPAAAAIHVVPAVAAGAVTQEGGIVRIGGTAQNDVILVTRTAGGQYLQVTLNGAIVSSNIPVAAVSEVRAWGRAGNDRIELVDLALLSLLHGGDGNDELIGAAGADLIFGGAGDDKLTGGSGNDFLMGGLGADRIVGSAGHDILVAGQADSRYTTAALRAISNDWASTKAVDEALTADVLDETALAAGSDLLTGSSGADWFIVSNDDKITDFKPQNNKDGDVVTVL